MLNIVAKRIPSLPPLAWALRMTHDTDDVTLWAGRNVELGAGWFLEGAWDGEYSEFTFDTTLNLFGTGGRLRGDRLRLCTPGHILGRITTVRVGHSWYASNSIPFVLAAAGLRLSRGDRLNHASAVSGCTVSRLG